MRGEAIKRRTASLEAGQQIPGEPSLIHLLPWCRLLGFADAPEARPFYIQAGLEAAIVSTTDFSDPGNPDARASHRPSEDRGEVIYRNTPAAGGASV